MLGTAEIATGLAPPPPPSHLTREVMPGTGIASGLASRHFPSPPTSHLARELAPGTGDGVKGEIELLLPPGLASEEQASADRSHTYPAQRSN